MMGDVEMWVIKDRKDKNSNKEEETEREKKDNEEHVKLTANRSKSCQRKKFSPIN